MDYDEYKYDLIHDQVFVRSCEAFDSRVEPTSIQDILAALRMHPSSGEYRMVLFDEAVYSFFSLTNKSRRGMNRSSRKQ